jgi:uncharacterized protein YjiK
MRQVVNLIFSTLLLWVLVASCTNKKGNETESVSDKVNLEVPIKLDTNSDTKPQLATNADEHNIEKVGVQAFNYDLSKPAQTSVLSSELLEISALSFDSDENILYAVNDEKGILFSLDPNSGDIVEKMKFGKRGDYEGIEIGADGVIYVVKSNGNIVAIQKSNNEVTKIKTSLHSSNDVEGLGYNKTTNMLLLVCKGSPNLAKYAGKSKDVKSVFGWSIDSQSLIEKPILSIRDEDLISHFESKGNTLSKSSEKKLKKRLKNFAPSGIAYNQEEELYYLISTVGKTLIAVNEVSEIRHIEFLDDIYFSQPEGICFGEDNALYISNEGKSLVAKLIKFDAKK